MVVLMHQDHHYLHQLAEEAVNWVEELVVLEIMATQEAVEVLQVLMP